VRFDRLPISAILHPNEICHYANLSNVTLFERRFDPECPKDYLRLSVLPRTLLLERGNVDIGADIDIKDDGSIGGGKITVRIRI